MKTARAKRTARAPKRPSLVGNARALAKLRGRLATTEGAHRKKIGLSQEMATLKNSPAQGGIAPRKKIVATSEVEMLRARLAEAEETIRAIRSGEVDVVVVTAKKGVQLFSLEG